MKWHLIILAAWAFTLCCAQDVALPADTSISNDDSDSTDSDDADPDNIRQILALNRNGHACPLREVFVDCPLAHTCQRTCATLNDGCVISPECTAACFCKDGFARDANNKCVPIFECPGTDCPRNEEFVVCSDKWKCEKSCSGRNSECAADAYCSGGCQCRQGYFRDTNGACVKAKNCVAQAEHQQCPHKEIWRDCSYDCTELCNYDLTECMLASDGCRAGCFCDDNMVRINGRCVSREKCLKF